MRKSLDIIASVLIVLLAAAYVYRDLVLLTLFSVWVKPVTVFSVTAIPEYTKYLNPDH